MVNMNVVEEILEKTSTTNLYKPITVDKYVECDLGALLVLDNNSLDTKQLKTNLDDYLLNLTRDNAQLMFNQIWELPTERVDEVIVAKLPKQRFKLPRYKPVPKPRSLTKWEQFAKEKGITKTNKSKLTWDEQLQKWIPLYGYKRAIAEKEKDWVLEVPQNVDPMEDQFAKKKVAKDEKVAKNELQRLRNIAKSKNVKVPRFGITNLDAASSKELQTAITVARSSTGSLGKFQEKLPKEKEARGISAITPGASTLKRKLPPISANEEKSQNLAIVDGILNKRPRIDIERIVNRQVNEEQKSHSNNHITKKKTTKTKNKSASAKKPKNSQRGQRKGKTSGGRKRR